MRLADAFSGARPALSIAMRETLRTELLLSRRTVTLVATTGGEEDSVAKDEVRWMRKIRRRWNFPIPKLSAAARGNTVWR